MAAHAKGFTRQFRQSIPGCAPVKWPSQGYAGLDALFESCCARRVVSAQAHAPHPDPISVEIRTLLHKIDHGLRRHLVVAANWAMVLRFALAGSFEDQCCHATREERRLVGVPFLFG